MLDPSAATIRATIVAHRGASATHRENSPAAWQAAVEAGADVVEVDIRATRDMTLVCSHDGDLSRLAGRPEPIAGIDAADLAMVAAAGQPAAPLLDDLFARLPCGPSILFDVKDERPETLERLIAAAKASRRDGLIFGLHDLASVRHLRERTDAAILGLLASAHEEKAFFAAGGDILRLWESDATTEVIRTVIARGRRVWVTTGYGKTGRTVGDFDARNLRRMLTDGASGFLVNDPAAARAALFQREGTA